MKPPMTLALVMLSVCARAIAADVNAADPLRNYYGNTLLCQNQTNKTVCHLWLNEDGSYFVMYDRGAQLDVPVAGGNFRIEARRGRYQLRGKAGDWQVCLQPDEVPDKAFAVERAGEAFAARACYTLPERAAGESWQQAIGNTQYRFWLVRGHG